MNKKLTNSSGRRNTSIFYALLKQQPNYNAQYQREIKEAIIFQFTKYRRGVPTGSLSALSDAEYNELLAEMERTAQIPKDKRTYIADSVRRQQIHKILKKLSSAGISTVRGYDEVNRHIKALKGFGGRILPEFETDELESVYRAVCNYVDYLKAKQERINRIAIQN